MSRVDCNTDGIMSVPSSQLFECPTTSSSNADGKSFSLWTELPDSLLLHVFCFLSSKEVLLASEVCRKWHRLSRDEMLWKVLLQETYSTGQKVRLPTWSRSWRREFQRLYLETPVVESQVLKEHTDEVLHVTFSHDGRLLASSSKDCNAILWHADGEQITMQQKLEFSKYNWEYVQYCEFNADDTLLLVSGVNTMRGFSFSGEIFICNLQGLTAVSIIHVITSVPYDVFGAWLTDRWYISGSLEFMEPEDNLSVSELWANCVDESPDQQICLCRIVNRDRSSVRTVLIARPTGSKGCTSAGTGCASRSEEVCLIFTHGTATYTPHQIIFKWLSLSNKSRPNDLKIRKQCLNNKRLKNSEAAGSNSTDSSSEREHCIETHAHIIGMGLSPDHQFLYVNCRPWNPRDTKDDPEAAHSPPEISNEIQLRAYSLSTYQLLCVHTGHKAFTPNKRCFFIFLNVAEKLVVSGAEDSCAHVWDRHFGAKLATLKGHSEVVNSVAISPTNQEIAVSASDDHTIIVWQSRQQAKLKLQGETQSKKQHGEEAVLSVDGIHLGLNETEV